MCLVAIALNQHPIFRVVVVANRDEFYARPTADLAPWPDQPSLYAGQDLRAGGTWLGVKQQRLALLTNVREPLQASVSGRSRGALVRDFLMTDSAVAPWCDSVLAQYSAQPGFNLLGFDGTRLAYLSNRPTPAWRRLPDGLYGVSNAQLDTPWPKTQCLKTALGLWVQQAERNPEPLFAALKAQQRPPDVQLPNTGVGLEAERLLSTAFIASPEYGTRASTVVLMTTDKVWIAERRFGPWGQDLGRSEYQYSLV